MNTCTTGYVKLNEKATLILFLGTTLLIFIDRTAVAGVLDKIQDSYDLSDVETGAIGSCFLVGFLLMSPLSAYLSQYFHPYNITLIGLFLWLISVLGFAFAPNYAFLLIFRCISGAGEAGITVLAPPILLEIAPATQKSLWMAYIYGSIYVGAGFGFVYSPLVYDGLNSLAWVFVLEGIAMVPIVIVFVIAFKDPKFIKEKVKICAQIKKLAWNPTYVMICFTLGALDFTIGGLSFWGPLIIQKEFGISSIDSSLYLSIIALTSGIAGSLIGSGIYERMIKEKLQNTSDPDHLRTRFACKMMFFVFVIATVFGMASAFMYNLALFYVLLGITDIFIFMYSGVLTQAVMTCVEFQLREQANAISNIALHLFGDIPSSLVIGVVIDQLNYRWGIIVVMFWNVFAVLCAGLSWYFSVKFVRSTREKPTESIAESSSGGEKELESMLIDKKS